MSPSISKIRDMLSSLPKKDIPIAENFLDNRKFEDLLDIINSDIYLVRNNQKKEFPNKKYEGISLDDLYELKLKVSEYMSYLTIPEDNSNSEYQYFEDYD